MIIVSKTLYELDISLEDISKLYGYSSVNSFRNSSRYDLLIRASERIAKLASNQMKSKIIDSIDSIN